MYGLWLPLTTCRQLLLCSSSSFIIYICHTQTRYLPVYGHTAARRLSLSPLPLSAYTMFARSLVLPTQFPPACRRRRRRRRDRRRDRNSGQWEERSLVIPACLFVPSVVYPPRFMLPISDLLNHCGGDDDDAFSAVATPA